VSRLQVELAPKAFAELMAQFDWWRVHRSKRQAERWLEQSFQQIDRLTEAPDSYPVSAEAADLGLSIRDGLIGTSRRPTHRAVFTVQGDVVKVLTIRSLRQAPITPDDL
jgi:plasmid stabilization system protein ParE